MQALISYVTGRLLVLFAYDEWCSRVGVVLVRKSARHQGDTSCVPFGFRGFVEGIPITPKKGHSCTHFSFPTTCFVSRFSLREERKFSSTRGYLLDLLIQ